LGARVVFLGATCFEAIDFVAFAGRGFFVVAVLAAISNVEQDVHDLSQIHN
jgi:hypothetical protein